MYTVRIRFQTVADLRRRPEGAMAPQRKEKAINKAFKLLLEGAKIIYYCLFNPTEGTKIVGPPKKTALIRYFA